MVIRLGEYELLFGVVPLIADDATGECWKQTKPWSQNQGQRIENCILHLLDITVDMHQECMIIYGVVFSIQTLGHICNTQGHVSWDIHDYSWSDLECPNSWT
jgi:hypothetical protein